MRETMKNLIKNTITSIGIALTVFCITGMVFDIAYDGNFSLNNYQFSKMVIGCIIVGLGFGLPAMIYQKDNLPMPFKIIIHMGTGCIIYTIVAYTVGWIGGTSSILHGIIAAIFCNIELKNEGNSNRFTSNLICPVNTVCILYLFRYLCV